MSIMKLMKDKMRKLIEQDVLHEVDEGQNEEVNRIKCPS